jgi:hypothetical protein
MFFLIICLFFLFFLDSEIGVFKTSRNLKQFFSKSKNINILSMARLFLFGSRDIWFVVGLPIFLYSAGWSFWHVGSFLAFWIIGYGFCQSFVPFLIKKSIDGFTLEISLAKFWVFILMIIQLALLILIHLDVQYISTEKILIFVLLIYGGVFSINSALHSYLILKFSGNSSVTEDVGFYYSSNALGRFFGTFLSGYLYQITGITGCIGGSFIFILISFLIIKKL